MNYRFATDLSRIGIYKLCRKQTMNRLTQLSLIIACFTLTGCSWFAHKAKIIEAPSVKALHAKRVELEHDVAGARIDVSSARERVSSAQKRHAEAAASHAAEKAITREIKVQADALRMRVTVELRPEVDALSAKVNILEAQASTTEAALGDTGMATALAAHALAGADSKLAHAEQVTAEIKQTIGPEYEAGVAEIVAKANATERAYAKADKERLHLLGQKYAVIGIAVVSLIAALILRFYKPI